MSWIAGMNLAGYPPPPNNVSQFDTWGDAYVHVVKTVERFWDDDYARAKKDRFALLHADAVWMPLHTRLGYATIGVPFAGTTGGGEWEFWIKPTEGN